MGKRGKLILLETRKPPNWQEWNEMKSRKQAIKEAITMIQAEARSILDAIMGAESTEQACEIVKERLPDRKHLTYWLGQIGRRRDARLGRNLDFRRYLIAVVESLRSQEQEVVIATRDRDKRPKRKIVRQATAASRDSAKSNTDKSAEEQEELVNDKGQTDTGGEENRGQLEPPISLSETNLEENQGQDSETHPPNPQRSRVQEYALRNLLVFADCAVAAQTGPEAVFDVIARNFGDSSAGTLAWWLHRVGKGDLVPRTKGKDVVDAIRVVSHALYRQLKEEIGKPVARW